MVQEALPLLGTCSQLRSNIRVVTGINGEDQNVFFVELREVAADTTHYTKERANKSRRCRRARTDLMAFLTRDKLKGPDASEHKAGRGG